LNWDAAGAIGEIVGAAGVVFTLFYLARQISHSNTQTRINSLTALNTIYNDCFMPIYNSRENMNLWVTGLTSPESLPDVEREIFYLFMMRLMAPFETVVAQYHHGVIDELEFERYRSTFRNLVHTAGGQAWVAIRQMEFSPEAKHYLEMDAMCEPNANEDAA